MSLLPPEPASERGPSGTGSRDANGQVPLFDPPTIPDTDEHELVFEANRRGIRRGVHWAQLSNSVD